MWPVAYVVFSDTVENKKTCLEDVRKYCYEMLPPRDTAVEFYDIDVLPTTSVGKIDYRKLEKIAANYK